MEKHTPRATGESGARPIGDAARKIERGLIRQAQNITASDVDRSRVLRALEAAMHPLGLSDGEFATLRVLILATRNTDWQPGARPLAWPSNQHLAGTAGRSIGTIKARIRRYRLLGLLRMHDSANGKRRGSRNPDGSIVEAYGFDLSPLRERYAELLEHGDKHRRETSRFTIGQRQLNADARLVRQIVAHAAELALTGTEWPALATGLDEALEAARAARRGHDVVRFDALLQTVHTLRERALELLDTLVLKLDSDPTGSVDCPHIQIQTKPPLENVQAGDAGSRQGSSPHLLAKTTTGSLRRTAPIRTSPSELAALFPAAAAYVHAHADWDDACSGAARLGRDLGVRRETYVEAVTLLGREGAALALCITAERQARGEIRRTPGSYFAGMTERARTGQLDLARTLWAFATTPRERDISSRLADGVPPRASPSRAGRQA